MPNLFILVGSAAILSWFILGGMFLAYPTMKRIKDEEAELKWLLKIPAYLWFGIGIIADVAFNFTWGSWIFREIPKEMLFTSRLVRHWRGTSITQKTTAEPGVEIINLIDPGHIK